MPRFIQIGIRNTIELFVSGIIYSAKYELKFWSNSVEAIDCMPMGVWRSHWFQQQYEHRAYNTEWKSS